MSKALAKRDPRDIQLSGATLTATGIVFEGKMSFDEWVGVGQLIERSSSGVQWWAGDWLNYGQDKPQWGDKYEQAIAMFNRDYGQIANWKWTSRNVEISLRNDNLGWSHHVAVAHLLPSEQQHWLAKAAPESPDKPPRLSVRALRQAIKSSVDLGAWEQEEAVDRLREAIIRVHKRWPDGNDKIFAYCLEKFASELMEHGAITEIQR